ncbi:hypothetical protein [Alistipes sp. CHKCI003]|uniref:hypothetical protein n=1 Tax=Alistipes sp. CHKCI003 TaxID=1780376 RepID=UPI0014959F37|nr:hypothetical protein [Alistipes sp. CHKCI003]
MEANVFERPGQRRTCSGFAEGRKTILQKRTKNGREPIPAVLLSYANMRRNRVDAAERRLFYFG